MKKLLKTVLMSVMAAALTVGMLGLPQHAKAAGVDSLTDAQKNSSYGFFVWLSENADTADEREDAKVAAQILSNTIGDEYRDSVYNDGHISSHDENVEYADLLPSTTIGAENDATSLECLREAIPYIIKGNECRAEEDLPALKISSGLMAMAEMNANYQDNQDLHHTSAFLCMENLAFGLVDATWEYGHIPIEGPVDEPYAGWYTEEKNNYLSNSGETGHYKTLTDKQGAMKTTGFGVKKTAEEGTIKASDDNIYPCTSYYKYYAQEFSTQTDQYPIGSGSTPEEYLAYIDAYECAVIGHDYEDVEGTAQDATCTADGKEADQKCSRCGEVITGETIEKLGHNYEVVANSAKDPTCTEDGKKADQKCSRCGDTIEGETIPMLVRTDISKALVTGVSSKVYTGSAITLPVKLSVAGEALKEGTDYEVAYSDNINAGTAKVTITGKGDYKGAVTKVFTIDKAAQKMTVKAKVKKVKYRKLKKKKQVVSKVFTLTDARGTVSYKVVKFANKKAKKALKLNKKNGKITVKKGAKKGKYKMTVAVNAKGDGNYKPATKKLTVTVRVK